jgi:hypothetical protein
LDDVEKIRAAMSDRDGKCTLDGIVEMDEGFFGGPAEGGKRGRGTEKTAVLVSLSLIEWGKPKFARMEVLEAVDGRAIKAFAKDRVKPGSEIRTDGLNICGCLAKEGLPIRRSRTTPKISLSIFIGRISSYPTRKRLSKGRFTDWMPSICNVTWTKSAIGLTDDFKSIIAGIAFGWVFCRRQFAA